VKIIKCRNEQFIEFRFLLQVFQIPDNEHINIFSPESEEIGRVSLFFAPKFAAPGQFPDGPQGSAMYRTPLPNFMHLCR